MKSKVVIITGASQGLGLELAKRFINSGQRVLLCARNVSNLKKKLQSINFDNKKVIIKESDISNLNNVRNIVKICLKKFGQIDVLINNAGILGPKGSFGSFNFNEFKKTVDINFYGSVLMCKEVLPHFKRKKSGKIIQLSGAGAVNSMPMFSAYAASKAAIVRFSETLADEVKKFNIQVNSVAAGAINTQMLDEIIRAGEKKVGKEMYSRIKKQKKNGGIPFSVVTDLIQFLASDRSGKITGKLLSPKWDNWKILKKNIKVILKSDVFTLRRLRGKDRKLNKLDN